MLHVAPLESAVSTVHVAVDTDSADGLTLDDCPFVHHGCYLRQVSGTDTEHHYRGRGPKRLCADDVSKSPWLRGHILASR
eukprot:3925148-Amphidinium_carterae.1